jgi:hypothetical protein
MLENSNWLTGPSLRKTGQVIGYREEYVGETEDIAVDSKFEEEFAGERQGTGIPYGSTKG